MFRTVSATRPTAARTNRIGEQPSLILCLCNYIIRYIIILISIIGRLRLQRDSMSLSASRRILRCSVVGLYVLFGFSNMHFLRPRDSYRTFPYDVQVYKIVYYFIGEYVFGTRKFSSSVTDRCVSQIQFFKYVFVNKTSERFYRFAFFISIILLVLYFNCVRCPFVKFCTN